MLHSRYVALSILVLPSIAPLPYKLSISHLRLLKLHNFQRQLAGTLKILPILLSLVLGVSDKKLDLLVQLK